MAKLSKLEQEALNRLPEIVAATQAGKLSYGEAFDLTYLLENEFAEVVDRNPQNHEEIALKATQAGIDYVTANCIITASRTAPAVNIQAETPKPKGSTKMSFEIENIPVVAGKRGGGTRAGKYPFDALEVGQSFFVATEKSIASALTNAMKKYDVPLLDEAGVQKTKEITVPKTGEKRTILATKHVRVFTAVAETKDGVAGFRVGRTA